MASNNPHDKLLAVLKHKATSGDFDALYLAECAAWFRHLSPTDRLVVVAVRDAFDHGHEDEVEVLASYLPPAPRQSD
jgi:hypothetical protein